MPRNEGGFPRTYLRDSWHPLSTNTSPPSPVVPLLSARGTQGARSSLAAFARSQSLERARPCAFLSLQGQGAQAQKAGHDASLGMASLSSVPGVAPG